MAIYCPKCNNEILPYLRTGEYKELDGNDLVSFQCYFCVHCKKVFYTEHERYEFLPLVQIGVLEKTNKKQEEMKDESKNIS